jgi:hypothetical protein
VLLGLAHVERRVLEQGGGDELRLVLRDPPRRDAAERVADEHGRTIQQAQDRDDVLAVAVDGVGAGRVIGLAVAAQIDARDPPAVGDLRRQEVVGSAAARDAVQEDDERCVARALQLDVELDPAALDLHRMRDPYTLIAAEAWARLAA